MPPTVPRHPGDDRLLTDRGGGGEREKKNKKKTKTTTKF